MKVPFLPAATACLLLLFGPALAQQNLSSTVEKAGAKYINEPQHQGLSIGIIANGKVHYYNFGTIEKGKKLRPDSATIFEIGSLTKSFTGILLAHAVLERKLNFDDDIRKYLGQPYPNLAFNGRAIRIIDLADHTSGFGKNVPEIAQGETIDQIFQQYNNLTEQDFLKALAAVKLTRMPGTLFAYSNAGAQLLGIILERVYHMSYNQLVDKYICHPNHMVDTWCEVPESALKRFATGYDDNGNIMRRITIWRNIPAAGYLKSTVHDLVRYIKLNMDESDPAIALAHRVIFKNTDEYGADIGLYWFVKNSGTANKRVEHAGGSFGCTSYCMVYPGLKTGIVLLTNDAGKGTEREIRQMADEILSQSGLVR